MSEVRATPCPSCPYRRDVPSGVWAAHTYDLLVPYDRPTAEQPTAVFGCHASPDRDCHGWAVVGTMKADHAHDLLALRLHPVDEIPPEVVPLFDSHTEAAEHGKRDIANPGPEAVAATRKLLRDRRIAEANQ